MAKLEKNSYLVIRCSLFVDRLSVIHEIGIYIFVKIIRNGDSLITEQPVNRQHITEIIATVFQNFLH